MMIHMGRKKDVENSAPGSRATITIDGKAADAMRSVCERYRRSQKEFVEFAAKWLLAQDEDVAGPIMASLPSAYTADFAKLALERMAQGHFAKDLIPSVPAPEPTPGVVDKGELGGHGAKDKGESHPPQMKRVAKGGR